MESSSSTAAALAESHRDSFNAAYATLEQSIRSFSKEKLMYEQRIEGLTGEIQSQREKHEELTLMHQSVLAENKRLRTLHEENETAKAGLLATIASVERKQEILADALDGYQNIEQDIIRRYEAHEEFVCCLKYRQLQLLDWISDTKKINLDLETELQGEREKCKDLSTQIKDLLMSKEQANNAFLQEKTTLLQTIADIKSEIELKTDRITELQHQLDEKREEMVQQSEAFRLDKDSLTNHFEKCKTLLEEMVKELEAERTSLTNHLEDKQTELEEKMKESKETKETLQKELEETKASYEERLVKISVEKEDIFKDVAKEKAAAHQLSEQFAEKEKSLMEELTQAKMSLEQQTLKLTEEKSSLEKELEIALKEKEELASASSAEKSNLQKQLDEAISTLKSLSDSWKEEKEGMIKQTEEMKLKMTEEISKLSGEMEGMTKQAAEMNLKTSEEISSLSEEKGQMVKEIEQLKTNMEQMVLTHAKEKTELEGKHKDDMEKITEEYSRCKHDLRALYQRYQDQKSAIAKLVEDSGVRPVVLPGSGSGSRSSLTKVTRTPSITPTASPYPKVAPITPSKPISSSLSISPMPTAPSPRSILKRPKDNTEKGKSVSFGSTTITDFAISSGSSSEPSETSKEIDVSEDSDLGKTKRFKSIEEFKHSENLSQDVESFLNDEEEAKGKENVTFEGLNKKKRRYFKNNRSAIKPRDPMV